MRNKEFNNLIITNLTGNMKSSLEEKWNISERDEIFEKATKLMTKRWKIKEIEETLEKEMQNARKRWNIPERDEIG
jgi:flagellar motor component MotA